MKTQTIYECESCGESFYNPCQEHEESCKAEKHRKNEAARRKMVEELLATSIYRETTDDPVAAKINGEMFLIPVPFTLSSIKTFSGASELISTVPKPSEKDASMLRRINMILAEKHK